MLYETNLMLHVGTSGLENYPKVCHSVNLTYAVAVNSPLGVKITVFSALYTIKWIKDADISLT